MNDYEELEAGEPEPLVAAWRKFSDRFMDPAYRDDPNANHIRDAFAAGWDAHIEDHSTCWASAAALISDEPMARLVEKLP